MTKVGTAYVDVKPDLSGFTRDVNRSLESQTGGIKRSFAAVGKVAAVGLAAGAVGFAALGKGAIDAASDINESLSKNDKLFGKFSKGVTSFADTSAKSYGISKKAALEYTGVFGNLFRALGESEKGAATQSVALTKLAADMASFNNTSVEEALDAIRSGLTGETEPLRRFGVNMNDATLKAQALKMGLIKSTKDALDPHTKAMAAQALITAQTSQAHGDFKDTSGSLANQQKILKARFDDASAAIGAKLLPLAVKVANALNDLFTDAQNGTGIFGALADVFRTTVSVVRDLLPYAVSLGAAFVAYKAISGVVSVIQTLSMALGVLRTVYIAQTGVTNASTLAVIRHAAASKLSAAAAGVMAVATGALNAVMAMNPITLVVIAIAALVAGLVLAYQKSETFRNIVNGVFGAVKDAAGAIVGFVGNLDQLPGKLVAAGSAVVDGFVGGIKAAPGALADAAGWLKDRLVDGIKLYLTPYKLVGGWLIARVVDGVKAVPGLLGDAAGWLKNRIVEGVQAYLGAYKTVGTWLLNRLVDGVRTITGALGEIGGWIKNRIVEFVQREVEGFKTVGSWVLNRFVDGVKTVTSALSSVGGWLKNRILDGVEAVKDGFTGVGGSVIGWIVKGLTGGLDKVRGFVNDIIRVLNKGLGFAGIKIPLIAAGSSIDVEARATGGQIRRGTKLNQPVIMMGEEAPRHPEFVIPTNPAYRGRALGLYNQLGQELGVNAFATGGVIGKASGLLSDVAGGVFDVAKGVLNLPAKLLAKGASLILDQLPNPADMLPGWLKGIGKYAISKVGGWVKDKVSDLFNNPVTAMTKRMNEIDARGGPYKYGGGHGDGGVNGFDCSGLVSEILRAGGFLKSPITTDGLKVFGEGGDGKLITIGVRGSTGRQAHTMMKLGDRYLESGSGHGAKWVNGWSGGFPIHRHPVGFAKGGILSALGLDDPSNPLFAGWGLAQGGQITAPFVGSYKNGGVVPRDGYAYVHQGETVTPAGGIGEVRVFIGDRELTDIVRVEYDEQSRRKGAMMRAGVLA